MRRIGLPLAAVFVMIAATAEVAHACWFGCLYHFGFITVADGEVWYYTGCDEITVDGETFVFCYYSDLLN
ncbi:MAG TPA: hypothetical protein VF771_07730 [Longimicrobiaceae bacterium]